MSDENHDKAVIKNIIQYTYGLLAKKEENNLNYLTIIKRVKDYVEDQTKNDHQGN